MCEGLWFVYNGILLSSKENEILPFAATQMKWDAFTFSEVSQTGKNIYMVQLIYGT